MNPSAALSCFQMRKWGLERSRDLVGATYRWQLGLDFLPSPHGLTWASLLPTPAPDACLTPMPASCSLSGRKRTQGALAAVSRLQGPQGGAGHLALWRKDIFSDSCPTRAGAATNCRGSCPSLGVFKQGLEAAGSSWGRLSDHQESF